MNRPETEWKMLPNRNIYKRCPFCGSKAAPFEMIGGLIGMACMNYNGCGAIVSFDNPECNANMERTPEFWNRRAEVGKA